MLLFLAFLANGPDLFVAASVPAIAVTNCSWRQSVLLFECADRAIRPSLTSHFSSPHSRIVVSLQNPLAATF